MSIEELIQAHTKGSSEALVKSILKGEQDVKPSLVKPLVPRPTTRDEAVGSLMKGFLRLKHGK